jgi:hypothetical protein
MYFSLLFTFVYSIYKISILACSSHLSRVKLKRSPALSVLMGRRRVADLLADNRTRDAGAAIADRGSSHGRKSAA